MLGALFGEVVYIDITGPLMWFAAAWFTTVGGGIGSFMNVVIYRSPLGKSVVHPGSRCPRCGYAIRWYDNVPVLSWLNLRGRCRNCDLPIAARYPIVEAMVSAIFFAVAVRELFTGGANLSWPMASPRFVPMTLFGVYACQMWAICTLICAALIEYDGLRMPKRLLIYAVVLVVLASPWLPGLPPQAVSGIPLWLNGLAGAGAGAVLGCVARLRFWGVSVRRSTPELELMLFGVIVGWSLVTVFAALAAAVDLLSAVFRLSDRRSGRWPWNATLAIGLFACIAFYSELVGNLPAQWLVDPLSILAATGAVAVASVLTAACDRRVEAWQQREKQIMADESDSKKRTSGTPHQQATHDENLQAILQSPSYRIAAYDTDFLHREELRPVRLQLELLKPEMAFQENGIRSTVVVFGGTQIVDQEEADRRKSEADTRLELAPDDQARTRDVARAERIRAKAKYYDQAREFGRIVSSACQVNGDCDYVVITGGGPGVMEAANRGAFDAGAKSIGLNITLPAEQRPNPYISPELCFQFHYFALRKMHFLMRAKALVVFPGGFGTLDELFDALTLRQTQRMQEIPIILFGREYWDRVIDFQFLADEGVIADEHLDLIDYAETAQEAWEIICRFHESREAVS